MKKKAAPKKKLLRTSETRALVRELLVVARLRAEKCELLESHATYLKALELAKRDRDLRGIMEAIAGLLRLASEAQDKGSIDRWNSDLDGLMKAHPGQVPPMAWYCKGMIAFHQDRHAVAQRSFHRFLNALRAEEGEPSRALAAWAQQPKARGVVLKATRRKTGGRASGAKAGTHPAGFEAKAASRSAYEEGLAKGWLMVATCFWRRGKYRRAEWLALQVLQRYQDSSFHGIIGSTCVLLAWASERRREFDDALKWLQQAHGSFLADHNWYNHLWLLFGYARLARAQQNYSQAYWYLDLVEKAATGPEFGLLHSEVKRERSKLEQDAVDLLIDSRKALIRTRESGSIRLGKQYVLLHILEALTKAHGRDGADDDRGLSKAEIIESVWRENYRPEAHDNKLYYNINRLRKLIEPDVRKPQYLLNWKEGYRLAPGLRVQLVTGGTAYQVKGESKK